MDLQKILPKNAQIPLTHKDISKTVDHILKKEMHSRNSKKPYKLNFKNNSLIISPVMSENFNMTLWYHIVQTSLNQYFYKKEPATMDIPTINNLRTYVLINNQEYRLPCHIVIKSIPICRPKIQKKKDVTPDNKNHLKDNFTSSDEDDI